MSRKTNQAAIALIKSFEDCKLTAYKDSGGVWTIGYGHTGNVQEGDTITVELAESIFQNDVSQVENQVNELVRGNLSDNQYGAIISFTFNLGQGTLKRSSLLSKLNSGDINGAADEFPRWCKIKGVVSPGLERRRLAERALFLS